MPINQLVNTASVTVAGDTLASNPVTTLLQLPPTIVKSVDITLGAKIGDTLTYTVIITNLNLSAMTNIAFSDPLPEGCEYVDGSLKLNGSAVVGTVTGGALTYTIANLAALGVATLTFQVTVVEADAEG